jgi:hypothetical protein
MVSLTVEYPWQTVYLFLPRMQESAGSLTPEGILDGMKRIRTILCNIIHRLILIWQVYMPALQKRRII